MKQLLKLTFLTIFILMCLCGAGSASNFWELRENKTSFSINYSKRINRKYNSYNSYALNLKVNYNVSKYTNVVFELPIIKDSANTWVYDWISGYHRIYSEGIRVTKPYLGVEFNISDLPLFLEIGLRRSYVSKDTSFTYYNSLIDDFENHEAYIYDSKNIIFGINHYRKGFFYYRVRGRIIKMQVGKNDNFNKYNFAFKAGIDTKDINIVFGFMLQTFKYLDYERTTSRILNSTFTLKKEHINPMIGLQIYTDYNIKPIYSLKLGLRIKPNF